MNELDVIQKKIRERMNDIADALATGSCQSLEEYKRMCGVIEGLAYVERDMIDLRNANEAREDQ
jgi:hypothetical protein